jgi:hypothetical protein
MATKLFGRSVFYQSIGGGLQTLTRFNEEEVRTASLYEEEVHMFTNILREGTMMYDPHKFARTDAIILRFVNGDAVFFRIDGTPCLLQIMGPPNTVPGCTNYELCDTDNPEGLEVRQKASEVPT